MQKNSTLIVAALMLVVGLGVGYGAGISKGPEALNGKSAGMHVMPDGTSMSDADASMTMADMMHSMNGELEGKTGDEFDKAFLSEMIIHHEGAVSMAELALANAKHQEIKDLAAAIIEAQNREIADMKAWNDAWYGNN